MPLYPFPQRCNTHRDLINTDSRARDGPFVLLTGPLYACTQFNKTRVQEGDKMVDLPYQINTQKII